MSRISTAHTYSPPLASARRQADPAPTAPKAIIEILSFNGDGTIDTPKVTLSVNFMIINEGPGSSGTYTVDTSTANGICTGTLKFNGGAPNFDIYFGPSGNSHFSLIQTDKGNVSLPGDGD